MSKEYLFIHPETGRKTVFQENSTERIIGGTYAKTFSMGMLQGNGGQKEKCVELVIRRVESADLYIAAREAYIDAGIPTVPWVRKIDKHNVAIPNLTREGGGFYGKQSG